MKITLDLDLLLSEGKISQAEYEKFSDLAARSTSSLAFNIMVGFGVIAVSGGALALVPSAITALIIGLAIFIVGLFLLRKALTQWSVLANICVLVGALMSGAGLIALGKSSLLSIFVVTGILAIGSILACSSLLAVLATLMLSTSIGASTGYMHASYFLLIQEPSLTIVIFAVLAIGLYQLSRRIPVKFEGIALAASRAAVFLVNFGFWVGSLWGERAGNKYNAEVIIPDYVFSLLWAIALLLTALWAWKRNRRWVVNTVATFAGIHFYTQWFEILGASAASILFAGLFVLAFTLGLKKINVRMVRNK